MIKKPFFSCLHKFHSCTKCNHKVLWFQEFHNQKFNKSESIWQGNQMVSFNVLLLSTSCLCWTFLCFHYLSAPLCITGIHLCQGVCGYNVACHYLCVNGWMTYLSIWVSKLILLGPACVCENTHKCSACIKDKEANQLKHCWED